MSTMQYIGCHAAFAWYILHGQPFQQHWNIYCHMLISNFHGLLTFKKLSLLYITMFMVTYSINDFWHTISSCQLLQFVFVHMQFWNRPLDAMCIKKKILKNWMQSIHWKVKPLVCYNIENCWMVRVISLNFLIRISRQPRVGQVEDHMK